MLAFVGWMISRSGMSAEFQESYTCAQQLLKEACLNPGIY